MTLHEWFAGLFYFHPLHAVLILADLVLAIAMGAILARNYRKMRTHLTLLFLLAMGFIVVAELLDVAEHFVPIHPARMLPMTAALATLFYLLTR